MNEEKMLTLVKQIKEKGLERVEQVTKETQLDAEIKLLKSETQAVISNEVNEDGKDVYSTVAKKEAELVRRLKEMDSYQSLLKQVAELHQKRLVTEVELHALENGFRAYRALLVGFTAGYGIWYTTMRDFDVPFTFPWLILGQIILSVYLAAIIFTIIPAYKASKIQPAEAIRHIG